MINDNKMAAKTNPIKKEEEVQQNPDEHIDQDFPGFPHLPADKKSITPKQRLKRNRQMLLRKSQKRPMVTDELMTWTTRERA